MPKHQPRAHKPLALITGASSGIGLALAQCFAAGDHDLIIIGDDTARIEAAAEQLRRSKGEPNVHALTVDLAEPGSIDHMLESLRSRELEPDVLVCNAGVGVYGDFARETDLAAELRMIQLNVCSIVTLTKHIAKLMVERGSGKILFTASVAGLSPTPLLGVYGATKAFVFSFAEALRNELSDTKISVTALCPGATDTNFFNRAGMQKTKTAQGPLAEPARVAQAGYDALMRGDDHVVTPFKDRVRSTLGKLVPPPLAARSARVT